MAQTPRVGTAGQPRSDGRLVPNGIVWKLGTGSAWRDVPDRYGSWQALYTRCAGGLWTGRSRACCGPSRRIRTRPGTSTGWCRPTSPSFGPTGMPREVEGGGRTGTRRVITSLADGGRCTGRSRAAVRRVCRGSAGPRSGRRVRGSCAGCRVVAGRAEGSGGGGCGVPVKGFHGDVGGHVHSANQVGFRCPG
ncbi:transposase [Streptomyces hayashii]|uniref:transposase n=1 Tax=Streptomyces hayashii TaxID=2839966 RepID=UPI00403D120A